MVYFVAVVADSGHRRGTVDRRVVASVRPDLKQVLKVRDAVREDVQRLVLQDVPDECFHQIVEPLGHSQA